MNHLRQSKNGQWEVRIVVPADCRDRIGKANLTRRLGRITRSEANRLAADIVAEFKTQIEKARQPLPPIVALKPHQAIAALGRWRDSEIARVRTERFNQPGYGFPSDSTKVGAWIKQVEHLALDRHKIRQRLSAGMLNLEHDTTILSILAENGMQIEATHPAMPSLRQNFAQMLIAVMDADDAARSGDYGAAATETAGYLEPPPQSSVSTATLIDGYAAERQPPSATLKRWRRMFASLTQFVGHDDAARISPENIVSWKASLLSKNLSADTVKSGYLAGVKAVFAWAAANRKIAANPASGVTVHAPKKRKVREKGFTPDEAATILRAASTFSSNKATPLGVRARRWVPWLCAYTGARVGEIAQLRRCDVTEVSGHWAIRITPVAGTVKNCEARLVPVHPHLIETGFLKMVDSAEDGPLFYEQGCKSVVVATRVGNWVREIGITDPTVQPNHAWRHLWKTRARMAGIDADARDAIQGHATRTEGEEYGEWTVGALATAMARFPRFDV